MNKRRAHIYSRLQSAQYSGSFAKERSAICSIDSCLKYYLEVFSSFILDIFGQFWTIFLHMPRIFTMNANSILQGSYFFHTVSFFCGFVLNFGGWGSCSTYKGIQATIFHQMPRLFTKSANELRTNRGHVTFKSKGNSVHEMFY